MGQAYTLLIADDEFFILERLKRLLAQEQTDFTLLAACANGRDAMEKIETLQPDLAILDIKMPFLTGLEIAEQIKSRGLPTRVILLTSFDLFDFAQQAVSYRVLSYLLKPIKADNLLHVLRDAHAEIAAQHEEKEKLQSYAAHAQEQELYLFLSGSPLPPDLRQTLPLLSAAPVFRLLLLKLTAADMLPDSTAVVREALDAILPSGSFLCASMSESAVACVLGDEACRSVKDLSAQLQTAVCRRTGGSCSLVFARAADADGLPALCRQALTQLSHTLFYGANVIAAADRPIPEAKPYSFELQRLLPPYFQQNDAAAAEQALRSCFQTLREHASIQNLELLISELFRICSLAAGKPDELMQRGLSYRTQLLLENSSCLADIEDWCVQYLRSHLDCSSVSPEGELTGRIRRLIQSSYAGPTLNLPYIAETLGYTPNYISTVFKKETGISVVQYITEQRMLAAKQLLSVQKLSVNVVCEKVGYTNPFYFSRRFKAYFGYAPSNSVHP